MTINRIDQVSAPQPCREWPDGSSVVPPAPSWLADLAKRYATDFQVAGLDECNFQPEEWWKVTAPLITAKRGFKVQQIGLSAEGRALHHIMWGSGKTTVLLWSQMHGDESTASRALADLFRLIGEYPDNPFVVQLQQHLTLHVMPIVNPDGAARFQRYNAQGIDLNRDARALRTSEAMALKGLHDRVKPDFGFNLHDQRVGYRVGLSNRGVALALLAPAFDHARSLNPVRARAIKVAGLIRSALEYEIGGHISRWDDSFNPCAFGDLMTLWGTSVILIESGGVEGDAQKQRLRELNFYALTTGLDAIATGVYANASHALYEDLPFNGRVIGDLLIRGGTLLMPGTSRVKADLLINFALPLLWRGGSVVDVGDLEDVEARRTLDVTGMYIVPMEEKVGLRPLRGNTAHLRFSRDPEGKYVAWTLDHDLPKCIYGLLQSQPSQVTGRDHKL